MSIIGNSSFSLLAAAGKSAAASSSSPSAKVPAGSSSARSFSDVMSDMNPSAVDKFMKYQQMSPAEKYRAQFLSEQGLSEDDLKNMTVEERTKVESKIAQRIKEKLAESMANKAS